MKGLILHPNLSSILHTRSVWINAIRRCTPVRSGNLWLYPTSRHYTQGWWNVQSSLRHCRSILVLYGRYCRRIGRNAQLLRLGHGCECHTEHSDNHRWFRPCGSHSWFVHARRNHALAWVGRCRTINCWDRICGNRSWEEGGGTLTNFWYAHRQVGNQITTIWFVFINTIPDIVNMPTQCT